MTNKMIDGEKLLEWIPQNCSKECITDDFYHKLKEKIQSLMSEPATDTNVGKVGPSSWQVGDNLVSPNNQIVKTLTWSDAWSDYGDWHNIDAERRTLQAEIAELKIEKETNND